MATIELNGTTYDLSTQAGRQAARDANPGWIVDATSAYNPSTGQSVGATGTTITTTTVDPNTAQQTNVDAQVALFNAANQQALIAYYNSKLQLDTDELAFKKATQAFQNTITAAGLTGEYQGQPTLAAKQQQFSQALAAQQEARLQAGQQQQTAQGYLTLLSNLRGPADWAQYQKVLGATPQGMTDLVRAAAGQYIPGGGATTGVQPQAVNLQNFVAGATGGGMSASDQAAMNSLVAPNQLAPQTWKNLTPSQQQVLLGAWEAQGYTAQDARALFEQSLPRYATQTPNYGTFRLQ